MNSEIKAPRYVIKTCQNFMDICEDKSEKYFFDISKFRKIENILKLPFNMNIIKVIPDKYEFLYSKFKNLGFDSKQTYIPNK